ncbi:SPOR domain-containing protein [Numidum massiliense]|uniref:SPOR domain-containing protein n=1 Tax=Numidum massiliense TaxID=1522315 RepID=UPI0009E998E6|nr:SPOR domain-containing protein [Numidum massiliense]
MEGRLPFPKPIPQPSGKLYRVQLGAFEERKNAEALATKAKKAKFRLESKIEGRFLPLTKIHIKKVPSRNNGRGLLVQIIFSILHVVLEHCFHVFGDACVTPSL